MREAQAEFETALALDRNNADAVRNLGWASLHLGEPEACLVQAEKGLRVSPRDPAMWAFPAQLGVCHLFLNHADLATDYLMNARTIAPQVWWIPRYSGATGTKNSWPGNAREHAANLVDYPFDDFISERRRMLLDT